jgi:hypothetical protein
MLYAPHTSPMRNGTQQDNIKEDGHGM